MLICDSLGCNYGQKTVFRNLSFTLGTGALVILHGPNGSGKTSFLKIAAGISTQSCGTIKWQEKEIGEARSAGLRVNFVGHKLAVKPELTVRENLEFMAALSGNETMVPAALSTFMLSDLADRPARELSSGWQKRVSLARLVCCPAPLWLLDEPYNSLDLKASLILDELIHDHCESGGIVVLSTHTFVPIEFAIKIDISDFHL